LEAVIIQLEGETKCPNEKKCWRLYKISEKIRGLENWMASEKSENKVNDRRLVRLGVTGTKITGETW
jgi:hypothetical protein